MEYTKQDEVTLREGKMIYTDYNVPELKETIERLKVLLAEKEALLAIAESKGIQIEK